MTNSVLSTKYLLRTKYGFLLALLLLSAPAGADDLADRIVERLASYPVVRAEFVQERTVASLTKPVVSTGRLVFSREGLTWQVEAPVKMAIVYSANVSAEGGAVQAEMGRLIRALIAGDLRELRTTFDVVPRGDLERWTLHLRPKTLEIAQYLRGIELAGGQHLEAIDIVETSGDRLKVRMKNFDVTP
jgi:hypothetical protein